MLLRSLCIVLFALPLSTAAQPLAPDPSFGDRGRVLTDLQGPTAERVRAMVVDESDRIVSIASGFDQLALVRQLADGALDPAFGNAGIVPLDFAATDLALQDDGRIVVAGVRTADGTGNDFLVARFGADGSVDIDFGNGGRRSSDFFGGTDEPYALAVDTDGSIILAGLAFDQSVGTHVALARYDGAGNELALHAEKIVSGTADILTDVLIQPDGRVVGIGLVRNFSTADAIAIRFERDFARDTSFGSGGLAQVDFDGMANEALAGLLTPAGIVLGGFTEVGGGDYALALARLTTAGQLDTAFGGDGRVVTDVAGEDTEFVQGLVLDGSDVVAVSHTADLDDFLLARYASDGALVASFGSGGLVTTDFSGDVDAAVAVALHQGLVLVAGGTRSDPRQLDNLAQARYLADGTLDTNFGGRGTGTAEIGLAGPVANRGRAIALQADGKSVVAGHTGGTFATRDFAVVRYLPDGSLDAGFGTGGSVGIDFFAGEDDALSVALDADGRILVAGSVRDAPAAADFGLVRLLPDGSLDTTFGAGGRVVLDFHGGADVARQVLVQPDGAIVLVGEASNPSFYSDFAAVRLLGDGSLDSTFGAGGKALVDMGSNSFDVVGGGALAADGSLYLVGSDGHDLAVLKLTATGTPDATFGAVGRTTLDFFGRYDIAHAALLTEDSEGAERLLAVGTAHEGLAASTSRVAVAAFDDAGALDVGFGSGGSVVGDTGGDGAEATAALLHEGRIWLAGHVLSDVNARDFLLFGLLADGTPDPAATLDGSWTRLDFQGGQDEALGMVRDASGGLLAAGWGQRADGIGQAGQDFALARFAASVQVFADGFEAR